jgi:transposase-like protein
MRSRLFDAFVEVWGIKYDKAVECLIKDLGALLAFYDFPAASSSRCRLIPAVTKIRR